MFTQLGKILFGFFILASCFGCESILIKKTKFINDIIGRYASFSSQNIEVWDEETRELVPFLDSSGEGRLKVRVTITDLHSSEDQNREFENEYGEDEDREVYPIRIILQVEGKILLHIGLDLSKTRKEIKANSTVAGVLVGFNELHPNIKYFSKENRQSVWFNGNEHTLSNIIFRSEKGGFALASIVFKQKWSIKTKYSINSFWSLD